MGIRSKLISNIIEVTVKGEKFEDLLIQQMKYLSEIDEEHTGIGLYVYFKYDHEIEKFRLSESQLQELFGNHAHRLEKFELINFELRVLADTTVYLSDGLIDCVEIWNKLGEYPKEELVTYNLKRH